MSGQEIDARERRLGAAAGLGAYVVWGLLPIYLKAVGSVPSIEVVANRIGWSAILVFAMLAATRRFPLVWAALRARRILLGLLGSTIALTINWGVYTWSIPHGHTVEAGFGYLCNPLVLVLMGSALLGERLTGRQWAAVGLAALGVATLAYEQHGVPWIVLVLPVSWGFYGLIRKLVPVEALVGLGIEILICLPFVLAFLATRPGGGAAFGQGWDMTGLLALSAPLTAVPLTLFAYASRRMKLATLGLFQYVSPSIAMLIGTLAFGEPFPPLHGVALAFVWAGVLLYTIPAFPLRRAAPAPSREAS